ncbi:MAG: zinc ABC transporter substrate-binding protein [Clostridiales bacterium]|nr:zinc ABC transporter substrate-binding protein [Clostridiales bacterium]
MRKIISVITALVLAAVLLTSCGNPSAVASDDTIRIVTTIFPEYDWVMNVLGDNPAEAEVTMLLDSGVDLHSFQPTAEDILKVSTCDLFIYVGGESDEWVEDALNEAVNDDMVVINLLEILGDKVVEEELIEGMEAESEEAEDEEEVEYDEHVWLSLRNAQTLVDAIGDAIGQIDPDNSDLYETNAQSYIDSFATLDAQYVQAVEEGTVDTILVADRFPFRYLVEDYGLNYYAAFVGCSAETEASFETITFLSDKVDELGLNTVLTIEGSDQRIAQTVVSNTSDSDQQILVLDSMQSTTGLDALNGASYLGIMESNLQILKEALG